MKKVVELVEKNDLIGHYRSISDYDNMLKLAKELLELVSECQLQDTEEGATTFLNVATAYRAVNQLPEALEMYEKAKQVYESLGKRDAKVAGLYNNMSMAYQSAGQFDNAIRCLENALEIILQVEGAESEIATTYVNLAGVYFQKGAYDAGTEVLEKAIVLFEEMEEADAHFAGALALLGQGYYQKQDYENAIACYTRALQEILTYFGKNESYAITCENCAMVLKAAGYEKEAEHLQREAKITYDKIRGVAEPISGLTLSKKYYEAYGKQMLEEQFPAYVQRAAVGLVGHGSECLGFDDEISQDHDFGPGFCIWLTKEDYDAVGEQMQEAYDKLPKAFMGFAARNTSKRGENRVGVFEIQSFYEGFLGSEAELAMAVNGEVFVDPLGRFTEIRNRLKKGDTFPIWKQKLANSVALMAQAGQYNYIRCLRRGDAVAASLALHEFIKESMHTIYLLNHSYMPYYKWAWRGLEKVERLSNVKTMLEELLKTEEKEQLIEEICSIILLELKRQHLTYGQETFLEDHVNRILEAEDHMDTVIEKIVALEWEMFQNTRNEGGRASCQDDWETFEIMRKSQYLTWNESLLHSFYRDLLEGKEAGRNLIMEKYAYMMESTEPEEYEKLKAGLPMVSEEKKALLEQIVAIQVDWREEFARSYPHLSGQARIIRTEEDTLSQVSFETYLRGELKTYSMETLVLYGRHVVEYVKAGKNLTEEIMKHTVAFYGYDSLADAELRS